MKKHILLFTILFISLSVFAQEKSNVTYDKKGDLTEATYYYEDGKIQQQGTFNKQGKLHGVWTSYDINGDKLSVGNYDNGRKVGKWLFWTKDFLKEVEYSDSKIVSVNQWENKSKLAVRN
jgi:antitoxin component YwqK of YwqJK toxin-antitoxin module